MKTCSFFGHRDTKATPELCEELRKTVVRLIEEKGVKVFLFGSASKFDELSLKIVTDIKQEYTQITRVYVRAQYPHISEEYRNYLLQRYDDTIMPSGMDKAGKAGYVERNQAMINASDFCVFYYDEKWQPPLRKRANKDLFAYQPKSGTRIAYEYAIQKKKEVINLCQKQDYEILKTRA